MGSKEEISEMCQVGRCQGGSLTFCNIDCEGAFGDLSPSEGDINSMWPFQDGPVSAAEDAVAFVLQHHLHSVAAALGIHNHHTHVTCACTWEASKDTVRNPVCTPISAPAHELPCTGGGGGLERLKFFWTPDSHPLTICLPGAMEPMSPVPSQTSLTCRVNVKVGGLVGHIAHRFQAWTPGSHLVSIPQCHAHIDFKGALVNILPRKEHSDLCQESKGGKCSVWKNSAWTALAHSQRVD